MGKRRDYSDYLQFIDQHLELTETKVWEEYKAQGGSIQKKRALDLYREHLKNEYGVEKQKHEKARYTTREIIIGKELPEKLKQHMKEQADKKAAKTGPKPAEELPRLREQQEQPKPVKKNIIRHYVTPTDEQIYDINHDLSRRLLENIQELYGTDGTEFVKINMKVLEDEYTLEENGAGKTRAFGFFIPAVNQNDKYPLKKFFKDTLNQAIQYYNNLTKKYTSKNGEFDQVINNFKAALRHINRSRNLDYAAMSDLLEEYGIVLEGIEYVKWA